MSATGVPAAGQVGRSLPPMRLGGKVGYAAGAVLDGVATQAINIFLFFYATAVCGLPAGLVGVALAAGLVVDAIVDPLIGAFSDGLQSRFGRRLPVMAVGVPGTMLFLGLLFSLPTGWSMPALFGWLTFLSIGLRSSISLFLLPYNAAGAELSDDYAERSSIAAWRWGIGMIGAMATVALGFGVFLKGPGGLSNRAAYAPFGITLGLLVAVGAVIAIRALHRMPERRYPPVRAGDGGATSFFAQVGELARNRSFRILFIGALLLFTSAAIHATLGIHANTYFWGMTPPQIQVVTLALFGGLLCGAPLAGPMLRFLEKRTVLIIGILGLGTAFALPPTLRLVGILPMGAPPPVGLLAGIILVGGALMATAAIAFASMMADAADEHEHLYGARREGLYFAGWAFAGKAAGGFGSLVAGLALQLIGFPSGAAHEGAAPLVLAPETARLIGMIYGPGAGLLTLGSALICLWYRLDAKAHGAIMIDLTRRREEVLRDVI